MVCMLVTNTFSFLVVLLFLPILSWLCKFQKLAAQKGSHVQLKLRFCAMNWKKQPDWKINKQIKKENVLLRFVLAWNVCLVLTLFFLQKTKLRHTHSMCDHRKEIYAFLLRCRRIFKWWWKKLSKKRRWRQWHSRWKKIEMDSIATIVIKIFFDRKLYYSTSTCKEIGNNFMWHFACRI